MTWQKIWQTEGTERLWSVPDPEVVAVARTWKATGDIRRVLDLGCGLGRHARLLAEEGFEVYGSDHSSQAIQSARKGFAKDGLPGEFWCSELDDIPYPDGFFDGMIAFNSLYHGTETFLERVVDRLEAKLRPGARCFVTLPSQRNRMYGKGKAVGPHTFLSPPMFEGVFEHRGEEGIPHTFFTEESVRHLFRGFEVSALREEELQLALSSRSDAGVKWLRIPQAFFWRLNVMLKPV